MKTEASIKNHVGRAIAAYNRDEHNDAIGWVVFGVGEFTVHTVIAKGDNVPWANKPLNRVIARMIRIGCVPKFETHSHCCGNVSMKFSR